MRIAKITKHLCILIFPIIIFTGCWDQKIYEQIGFILQAGYETASDGRLLVSYTTPVADPKKAEQVEFISGNVGLTREFRGEARRISAKNLEAGKIQQVVISKSLAAKGINNLLEIFERDPANPGIAYVVISEDSPKMLFDFAQKLGDKPRPSFYLNQLIENNSRNGSCPSTTIFEFTTYSFAQGIDPITPMIKTEAGEPKGIKIIGSALFCSDKMVGKLSSKDTSLLLAMKGKLKSTEYIFNSLDSPENDKSGKTGAAMLLYKPKKKLKIHIEDNIPIIDITLKFKGVYDEYKWGNIDKKPIQKKYEELMSEEIKNECIKVLKYTQEVKSDPIGIGDIIRAKYNTYWSNNNWRDFYSRAVFNVNISVDIVSYGIIK